MAYQVDLDPRAERQIEESSQELRSAWLEHVVPELQHNPYPRTGPDFDITDTWVRGERVLSFSSERLPGRIVQCVVEPSEPTGDFFMPGIEEWVVVFRIVPEARLNRP